MKRRLFATSGFLFLLAGVPGLAVTDTWDGNSPNGGAGDSNIGTALNWADNTAPLSDLVNTDLIFAGTTKLTPNFNVVFSADSVVFNNTAGAFTLGGNFITIGAGGIVNNDTSSQTFGNVVVIGTANPLINAASGALAFAGPLNIGGNGVTVTGAATTTLTQVSGAGTIAKEGAGTLNLTAPSTYGFDLVLGGGNVATTAPTTFSSASDLQLNTGTFTASDDLKLTGARLTRASGATFTLAAGKTLTIQTGADAVFSGLQSFTGAGSAIHVDGVGSDLIADDVRTNGLSLDVTNGGNVSTSTLVLGLGALANSATVSGNGSSLSAGSALTVLNSSLKFSLSASGGFTSVSVDPAESGAINTTASLLVESGADVTAGSTRIGNSGAGAAGISSIMTVNGAGSTYVQGGSSTLAVGILSFGGNAGTGALRVENGGTYTAGTGNASVNTTGTLAIASGTFNANGNLTLNGGQLTRSGSGALNLALGTSMSVLGGGDAVFSGLFHQPVRANLTVGGSGSSFTTNGDIQWEGGNSTLAFVFVTGGGLLNSGGSLHLGRTNSAVALTVSGAGSRIISSPFFTSEWQAGVLLQDSAAATLGGLRIADMSFGGNSSGSLFVQSGSTVSLGTLAVGSTIATATGSVRIEGNGSAVTQTGTSALTLGADFLSSATLEVNDGGAFTSGTGAFNFNATGVLDVDGGTATFNGPLNHNGGTVNFESGALAFTDADVDLIIGNEGLLGANLTLPASRELTIGGTTTIEAFRTLTLDGGSLRTDALVNNGTLDFHKGLLAITGKDGFEIGSGGALGASAALGTGARLDVAETARITADASLVMDGGRLEAGVLDNFGLLRLDLGVVTTTGATTNRAGAQMFLSDALSTGGTLTNAIGGRITLRDGTGRLTGAGALSNSGLITGDGSIAKVLTNGLTGEVRAESGKTLYFLSTTGANSGRLTLQGGTLAFSSPHTLSASGQINGAGVLHGPASPVPSAASPSAGLNVGGQLNFSGGDSFLFGTVALNAGGRLIASGGSTVTFFDIFRHSGTEVKASTGSNLVFFGEVRGAGSFTGTGTIYLERGFSPGNSAASIGIAPQTVLASTNSLTMEIGGRAAGSGHDRLTFSSAATPQITWGGTLVLEFINGFVPAAGDAFDLFDFDPARDAGTFSGITVNDHGLLPPGLALGFDDLYTTGTVRVVPVVPAGLTFADWAANVLGDPDATPEGDHDRDGTPNLVEFALGLFPPQPGTVLPVIDLHSYADGDSLRLRFTRPLDRTGIILRVQASSDLDGWEDLAISVDSAPFTGAGFVAEDRAHPLSEPGLVEARDTVTTSTPTLGTRRSLRLHFTLVP